MPRMPCLAFLLRTFQSQFHQRSYQPLSRFSSFRNELPSTSPSTSLPPNSSQTLSQASRAADLAAAEALTEGDSAQPPSTKPILPSQRSSRSPPPQVPPSIPTTAPRYHIARSKSNNLPVYADWKRGGNLHLTIVRKITGDLAALRGELRAYLVKGEDEVMLNAVTRAVVVKGHHVGEVKGFLQGRGF